MIPNEHITPRLIYGKFTHKVQFECHGVKPKKRFSHDMAELQRLLTSKGIEFKSRKSTSGKSRLDWARKKWVSSGAPKTKRTFCFNDSEILDFIRAKYKTWLSDVWSTLNDIHVDKLFEHTNVVFKPNLFFKKYKHRIQFCRWRNTDIDLGPTYYSTVVNGKRVDPTWPLEGDVFDFLKDQPSICKYRNGYNPTVYVNDDALALMLKLKFSDAIVDHQQVHLIDEL